MGTDCQQWGRDSRISWGKAVTGSLWGRDEGNFLWESSEWESVGQGWMGTGNFLWRGSDWEFMGWGMDGNWEFLLGKQ